jgi:hypothetical protein
MAAARVGAGRAAVLALVAAEPGAAVSAALRMHQPAWR